MTTADKPGFVASFNRLLGCGLKDRFSKKSDREMAGIKALYFETLSPLSIEAVEAAEAYFRAAGTTDGWFPSTAEMFQQALECEVARYETVANQPLAGYLPPSREALIADQARWEAERDRFLAELSAAGHAEAAQFFAKFQFRAPTEWPEAPWCWECGDLGLAATAQDDGTKSVGRCACAATNPRIRLRRIRGELVELVQGRQERARQLAPGSGR